MYRTVSRDRTIYIGNMLDLLEDVPDGVYALQEDDGEICITSAFQFGLVYDLQKPYRGRFTLPQDLCEACNVLAGDRFSVVVERYAVSSTIVLRKT